MLGHNPIVLNRLKNIKSTLEASVGWIDVVIDDPSNDRDFSISKTMLDDAFKMMCQISQSINSDSAN